MEQRAGGDLRGTVGFVIAQFEKSTEFRALSAESERYFFVESWFKLRRANAQVEWWDYPGEGHLKRSPAAKWWTYRRNTDWFRFWLQDFVDTDPKKSEQYERWEAMRSALGQSTSPHQ